MIKTTLKSVVQSVTAINGLLMAQRLPVKTAYAISKLGDACAAEMRDFDKARNKVFTDAGCTINDNQYTHDDPEVMKKCAADIEELQTSEVELNAFSLDLDQFGNAELPGNAFTGLDWAIKQGE